MVVFMLDGSTLLVAGAFWILVGVVLAAGVLSAIDFFVTAMGVSSKLQI
jgi:hypothetical protein